MYFVKSSTDIRILRPWIVIIKGLPTFLLSIVTWFAPAISPETAFHSNEKEKKLVMLRRSCELGQTISAQQFVWTDFKSACKDWKVWILCLVQFGIDSMLYGFSTFLPTIIRGIDGLYSVTITQGLTIPRYVLGALTYLCVA